MLAIADEVITIKNIGTDILHIIEISVSLFLLFTSCVGWFSRSRELLRLVNVVLM